jgi:hypothetical protein
MTQLIALTSVIGMSYWIAKFIVEVLQGKYRG